MLTLRKEFPIAISKDISPVWGEWGEDLGDDLFHLVYIDLDKCTPLSGFE